MWNRLDNGRDQLKVAVPNFPLEILYLRNSDIPKYLEDRVADIAIIGENLLFEQEKQVDIICKLGFSKCRVSLAIPKENKLTEFFRRKKDRNLLSKYGQ